MDIKLSLVLTDRGRKHTSLGFERIEVIDFGYDKDGALETVLCVGEYSEGHVPTGTLSQPAARGSDTGNMVSAARSKNGLRDFGPGGDNRFTGEP